MVELIFKDEVYAIIGAALGVYNTLHPGFAEGIYQESLEEESQMLNYLKATRYPVGLLVNFGNPDELEWKRMVGVAATNYRINQSHRFIRED